MPGRVNPTDRRILVIDDNDDIHHDFRKIFSGGPAHSAKLASKKSLLFGSESAQPATEKPQFDVDSASQGQEGLAKLETAIAEGRPYMVAFVDMRMPPGWDGLQTIQHLWAVDPDLQVVICSAYSDYSWDEIADKLGLNDRLLILKKPFDPAEVMQLARALSEKWLLRRTARLKMDELEQMVESRTKELKHIAMHDKLTGLPNRAMFNDRLAKAVARFRADHQQRFAVLFLDFDRFKLVNDSLGHEAGDELLIGIANRLTASLELAASTGGFRKTIAARLGGDEFVVLLEELQDLATAVPFADSLLQLLNKSPYQIKGQIVHSTASLGITTSDIDYAAADEALRDADTAMYHAKAAGKARLVMFDQRMHTHARARLEIENDLRGALERGELLLNYQPIVSLADGSIEGFEALVRWKHPKRGIVSPAEFIPVCEEIGLIVPLGYWVLQEACAQLREWTRMFPHLSHMTMSVNLSAKQFASPDLVERVRTIVEESGVTPSQLALEITESAVVIDKEASTRICDELRALGIRLHMDDFGTGYSSLNYLHQFPFSGLKIDKSFIDNLSTRRDYAAVVNAIIALARNLNMKLIAEGIETAEQVAMLQAFECDYAQGYYFDRPRDKAGAEQFIRAFDSRRLAA